MALREIFFGEIRLDRMPTITDQQVSSLFSSPCRLVATCRPGAVDDQRRRTLLKAAVVSGARYVDLELDGDPSLREAVIDVAREHGCDVIVSHHDYEQTPKRKQLVELVEACFEAGADVAKIACMANSARDSARLLGLLDDHRRLVVIGMGHAGVVTRVMGPLLGAEFSFARRQHGAETAPGQLTDWAMIARMRAAAGSA